MDIVSLLILGFFTAGLGIAFGIVFGRYVWPTVPIDREELAQSRNDLARREQECIVLRARSLELDEQLSEATGRAHRAGEDVARLNERAINLTRQIEEQANEVRSTEMQRNAANEEAKGATADVARLGERVVNLTRQVGEQGNATRNIELQRDAAKEEAKTATADVARLGEREKTLTEKVTAQTQQLAEMQEKLTTEFENIANRILKASASELSETSQKSLSTLLDPLRQRLQEFQQKVETTYDTERREVLSLKEQIKIMVETSHAIGGQADSLVKALRGDSQKIGRWGELALERILEESGLREGREYITQGRGLKLKAEDETQQKPDVVVMLPERRSLIVDSKVPLASYERLTAASDEAERANCRERFLRDVKGHIDDLAGKRYQENTSLQAHDCALMFVPIEGALAAALDSDPELFTYAWNRSVVLVGPSTLLMTMRTVASIWRYELQGENAQMIARLAGDLCDKLSLSLTDLNTVADRMNAALFAHNEALKRLSTGKGNALSIGERIRVLGVKTRHQTPAVLVDGLPLESAARIEDEVESTSEGTQPGAD